MRLEPWHIPILIMSATIVVEYLVRTLALRAIARRRNAVMVLKRIRTSALALMAALIIVLFVWAVGTSTADRLAQVASAVAEIMALWLTYQSYRELKAMKNPTPPAPSTSDRE
jgi:hypothetical protein